MSLRETYGCHREGHADVIAGYPCGPDEREMRQVCNQLNINLKMRNYGEVQTDPEEESAKEG